MGLPRAVSDQLRGVGVGVRGGGGGHGGLQWPLTLCPTGRRTTAPDGQPPANALGDYHHGNDLDQDKNDVDKFGSPPLYQMFASFLRMLCAKVCAPDTPCRGGGGGAACGLQCEGAPQRYEPRCQRTLCSVWALKTDNVRSGRP